MKKKDILDEMFNHPELTMRQAQRKLTMPKLIMVVVAVIALVGAAAMILLR